jgi:hypothetical protein
MTLLYLHLQNRSIFDELVGHHLNLLEEFIPCILGDDRVLFIFLKVSLPSLRSLRTTTRFLGIFPDELVRSTRRSRVIRTVDADVLSVVLGSDPQGEARSPSRWP